MARWNAGALTLRVWPSTVIAPLAPLPAAWMPKPPPPWGSGKSGTPWVRMHLASFSAALLGWTEAVSLVVGEPEPPHAATAVVVASMAAMTLALRSMAAFVRVPGLHPGNSGRYFHVTAC